MIKLTKIINEKKELKYHENDEILIKGYGKMTLKQLHENIILKTENLLKIVKNKEYNKLNEQILNVLINFILTAKEYGDTYGNDK